MEIVHKKIGALSATLTGYIQDVSDEMPHLDVRPAVLIVPGGAYRICSDREAEPVALAYVYSGFNAFVLRYTTLAVTSNDTTFAQALSEAEEAVSYMRENASRLHIDPERITAVGFSAGGHLAAALGVMGRVRPNALVLGYGVVTDALKSRGMKLPNTIDYVDADTPPTFLFATQGDQLVDAAANSLQFACALSAHGVPYEVHVFAKGDHGLSLANETVCGNNGLSDPNVAQWLPMSVQFLKEIWKDEPLAVGAGTEPRYSLDTRVEFLLCRPHSSTPVEKYLPNIRQQLAKQPEGAAMPLREWLAATGGVPEAVHEALERELAALSH